MDQIKPYLIQLKKHHFWVLSGLIPLIALVTWWMSAGKLDAETATQQQTIQAKKASLAATKASEFPPEAAEAKYKESQQATQENVVKVWQALYDRQQNFMKWPPALEEIPDREKFLTEIKESVRSGYATRIFDEEFKKVLDRLDLRRRKPGPENRRTVVGMPNAATQVAEMLGLVEFDPAKITAIRGRYINEKTPSAHRVRAMQEDIWLYDNLAWVIQQTNSKSKDVGDVAVKKIIEMDVGRFAVLPAPPQKPVAQLNEDGSIQSDVPNFTDDDWYLIGGRYLDETSSPTIDRNRFAEFRQIPVKMKLEIDQRRVQEFLINCANAPLMIEPRKLNITKSVSTGAQRAPSSAAVADAGTHYVTLDFSGVTYIYTQPNPENLGKGSASPNGQRAVTFPGAVVADKQVATNN